MPQKKGTTQQPKAVLRQQCGSCNDIFTGKACPNCGEKINVWPINADGIPLDEVANAVGSTHSLPINLARSPEFFDADFEVEEATRRRMKDVMQDAQLDKVKTLAAEQASKRLRAEKELEATEKGFMPPKEGDETQQPDSMNNMSSAMFMQALGGWNPEAREMLFDRLKTDPEFAFNLSRLLNPTPGMPQMGMMNPMAMMGGMMQPPAEQAPQASAADMLTAVIGAVAAIKEMSGGNDGGGKQMDRLLDKMDEMRRETEDLKLKLVEAQTTKNDVTHEDIRRIVADAVNTTTDGKIGLINGLKEIHTLRDELIGLGIASEPSNAIDPAQTLEERKFDHQIKMDEMKDKREHELQLKAGEAEVAKANVQGEFMSGLFAAAQDQHDEKEAVKEDEKPIDVVRVDARQASVIS